MLNTQKDREAATKAAPRFADSARLLRNSFRCRKNKLTSYLRQRYVTRGFIYLPTAGSNVSSSSTTTTATITVVVLLAASVEEKSNDNNDCTVSSYAIRAKPPSGHAVVAEHLEWRALA